MLDRAFEVSEILLKGSAGVLAGSADPSVSGYAAPIGSVYLRTNGDVLVKKTSSDTGWQVLGGGSAPAYKSVTLDFGSVPVSSKTFQIADASATSSKVIQMQPTPSKANSALGGDELEMDGFTCAAYCAADGTITAYIQAMPGPVTGKRNFIYSLG